MFERREVRAGGDSAILEGEAGVLAGIGSSAGEDHVVGAAPGAAEHYVAVLENGGGVSEDEIDCAVNVTFAVELAESEGV